MILLSEIEFTLENWEKCNCKTCPVQAQNMCFQEKNEKTADIIPKIKENDMITTPEMLPGMYCVNGKTTCRNLDTKQICQCYRCAIWTEYDLLHDEPMRYYCRDGSAKKNSD